MKKHNAKKPMETYICQVCGLSWALSAEEAASFNGYVPCPDAFCGARCAKAKLHKFTALFMYRVQKPEPAVIVEEIKLTSPDFDGFCRTQKRSRAIRKITLRAIVKNKTAIPLSLHVWPKRGVVYRLYDTPKKAAG